MRIINIKTKYNAKFISLHERIKEHDRDSSILQIIDLHFLITTSIGTKISRIGPPVAAIFAYLDNIYL